MANVPARQQPQQPQQVKTLLPAVRVARFGEALNLAEFTADKFNNLMPYESVQALSPLHMLALQVVQISIDPEDNEVYPGDRGKLRLAKRGLLRLGGGAGIVWVPAQTGIVYRSSTRVIYQAVGYLITPEGGVRPIKGTKELDLDVLLDEITEQQTFKVTHVWDKAAEQYVLRVFSSPEERQRQIDDAVRREMLAKRKNLVALAETGAYLRAIRSVLALKNEYRPAELVKPFVCVRVSINPQADAELAREMVRQTMGIASGAPVLQQGSVKGLLSAPTVDVSQIPEAPEVDEDEHYEGDVPPDEDISVEPGRLL